MDFLLPFFSLSSPAPSLLLPSSLFLFVLPFSPLCLFLSLLSFLQIFMSRNTPWHCSQDHIILKPLSIKRSESPQASNCMNTFLQPNHKTPNLKYLTLWLFSVVVLDLYLAYQAKSHIGFLLFLPSLCWQMRTEKVKENGCFVPNHR